MEAGRNVGGSVELPSDEIRLPEIRGVLSRRRYVAGAVLAVSLAAVLLHYLLAAPVFESRAVMAIGALSSPSRTSPLEETGILVARLKEEFRRRDPATAYLSSVSWDRGIGEQLVKLAARGGSPSGARDFLGGVMGGVRKRHQAKLDAFLALQEQRYALLKERLDLVGRELALPDTRAAGARVAPSGELERYRLQELRAALEQQLVELEMVRSGGQTRPTEIVSAPSLSKAVNKKPIYYILGVMLAFFLALVAAFFAEAAATLRADAPP